MKKLFQISLALLICSCTTESKVNFSGDLEIGIEKESTLKQETAESYQIQVDSNAFITGYVNQKTVDVVVKLFNEDDEEIGNIDSPARGLEHFSFTIDKTENYRIEVEPFKEESGDYSIKINAVEAIATEDNTFSGDIFFMSEVAFKKDENGSISAFTVGNGRTKGILFTKQ